MKKITIEVSDEDFVLLEEGAGGLGITVEDFLEAQIKGMAALTRLVQSPGGASAVAQDLIHDVVTHLPKGVQEVMDTALDRARRE